MRRSQHQAHWSPPRPCLIEVYYGLGGRFLRAVVGALCFWMLLAAPAGIR